MPRRIAVVTTSWPADEDDPAGHFVRTETRAMVAGGDDVVVVKPEPGGAFGWPGVAARVRQNPIRALSAVGWVAQAAARVTLGEFDAIVCHWAIPSAWPIATTATAPIEVVSHGGDVRLLAALPAPIRTHIADILARRSTTWRFVSDSLAQQLLRSLDGPTALRVERVAAVQAAAIDMPDVASDVERVRRTLPPGRTAVSVGRLVPSKRVDRVISHVASGKDFATLVVVGDGPERSGLERLARQAGVHAVFVGAVPRTSALAWIGAADALLHASMAEGMSTVIREAETLGTKVVRV